MAYRIVVQAPAQADARAYAAYIIEQSNLPQKAADWLGGLYAAIQQLSEMPGSYKRIEEQDAFDLPLHQLLYHSHRIVYHVDEATRTVHILRVYHGARSPLSPSEMPLP